MFLIEDNLVWHLLVGGTAEICRSCLDMIGHGSVLLNLNKTS
jgi:hypothetical protein